MKTITQNQNYYLNMIKYTNKAPNLKSNIFDKMLSNEMLSIKQHLHEKDVISPSVYLSFKNNVPTPKLEINQKWPIDKFIYVTSNKPHDTRSDISKDFSLSAGKRSSHGTKLNEIVYNDDNVNMEIGTKNKIIEVRSFSAMPIHTSDSLPHIQQAKRQCTCMNNNHHSICSHRGFGPQINNEKICTHTDNDYSTISPECTRTEAYSVSLTYFPYFLYPSYFVGLTTDAFKTYYHPDMINDLKLPKHKTHRKSKKPYEAIFLDAVESKEVDDDEENQYDYSENDKSDEDIAIHKCPKNKCKLNPKFYNINYENSGTGDSDLAKNIHKGYIKVSDSNKLVENIIEDLKVYYNDAVIKDCYCSLSSLKYRSKNMLIYIITILFILWY